MKKLIIIFFLLLGAFAFAFRGSVSGWLNMGNTLQRSSDGYNYRTNLGSPGFVYWYTMPQVDSAIAANSGGSYNFLNGVTNVSGGVGLGGSLSQNTSIDLSSYRLMIGDIANSSYYLKFSSSYLLINYIGSTLGTTSEINQSGFNAVTTNTTDASQAMLTTASKLTTVGVGHSTSNGSFQQIQFTSDPTLSRTFVRGIPVTDSVFNIGFDYTYDYSPFISLASTPNAVPSVKWVASNTATIIGKVTGVNAATTSSTALYTVPTGHSLMVTGAYVECTSASGVTTSAMCNIGVASNSVYNTAQTFLTTSGQIYQFPTGGLSTMPQSGQTVNFNVSTASNGSCTYTVILMGLLQ